MQRHLFALSMLLPFSVGLAACFTQEPKTQAPKQHIHHTESHQAKPQKEYAWQLTPRKFSAGKPAILTISITDKATGKPVQDLDVVHEKTSHLILISQDLKDFIHEHPEITGPGQMQVKTLFPREGNYIVFLQFTPTGEAEQTLIRRIQAGEKEMPQAALTPDIDQIKVVDGYAFKLNSFPNNPGKEGIFSLQIEKEGKPVQTIQPYLGAGGHAVLLSADGKRFLHVHPASQARQGAYQSPLKFHAAIPQAGLYKIWFQVQLAETVKTVDYTFQLN